MSRVVKPLKLPAVTGYLVAGILVGPFVLGQIPLFKDVITLEFIESFSIISDVALGFIAFAIGNEFRISQLKAIGKQATIIGIFQAVFATLLVDAALVALYFFGVISLPSAIILGAIASATAPAATLMVVKQYKAKGRLTSLLLPIVAIDDAVGLVLFAVSFGIAKTLLPGGSFDIVSVLVEPTLEIVLSLLLGLVMGVIFSYCEKCFKSNSRRQALAGTAVILTVALTKLKFEVAGVHIGFSSLLTCMMLGTTFCNICDFSEDLMEKTDKWTTPIYILFFVLSGAELDFSVFSWSVILIGIVYIITRSLGKYFGAGISAAMTKCESNVRKYLGFTLLPQAGVALGMAAIVSEELPEEGKVVRNIVLFGVLIYELFGPLITKVALTKSGDIQIKSEAVKKSEALEKKTAKKQQTK
ncbi:MAG: cation:proton antiporter [Clostridia bacterium]|nr:cation:proton antiporter [Clostridia bacterium]